MVEPGSHGWRAGKVRQQAEGDEGEHQQSVMCSWGLSPSYSEDTVDVLQNESSDIITVTSGKGDRT